MRVFLTGLGGFIGSELAARLRSRGHEVLGSASSPASAARLEGARVLALGDAVDPAWLAGVDALLHLAHDFRNDAEQRNRTGTRALVDAAQAAGVERVVYFSSYSAHPGARGIYGRTKRAIEEDLAPLGVTIVRPGLVLGPDGLFGRMVRHVVRWPVVPLPDGGRRTVPVVGLEELRVAVEAVLVRGGAAHNLAHAERPSLRVLMETIAAELRMRGRFLSVPTRLALGPLALLDRVGIRLGVDVDNLRGYRDNVEDEFRSDLAALGVSGELDLPALVRAAL